jgi:hypothetical protein
MVTGVEEEMKVTSNDERNNKINQLKPVNTSYYRISQSQPFYFTVLTLKSPD